MRSWQEEKTLAARSLSGRAFFYAPMPVPLAEKWPLGAPSMSGPERGFGPLGGYFFTGGCLAYKIKNWEKFQHYKNLGGHPSWIKLYRDLLNDLEWHQLNGECAKALVMLWLVASETGGVLPHIGAVCFALRMSESKLNSLLPMLSHWVYDDSRVTLEEPYSDPRATLEPLIRKEENKKRREEKGSGEGKGRGSDLLFDVFWKAYPKKVAKPSAFKAWERLRPNEELLRVIVKAIDAWKESDQWSRENGQFIPHPATWLNQRRWEDEIQPEESVRVWETEALAEIEKKKNVQPA